MERHRKGLGRCKLSTFGGLLNSALYSDSSYSSWEGFGAVPTVEKLSKSTVLQCSDLHTHSRWGELTFLILEFLMHCTVNTYRIR